MKTMHFGILIDPEFPDAVESLSLPPGFITDRDSFLVWGERMDTGADGDWTMHLIYSYETHRLPDPEKAEYQPHLLTANGPVRGWLKSQGVFDRERLEVARLRTELAKRVSETQGIRLIDYVVISDAEDWADAQCIWTLDGILTRSGS